MGHDSQPDIILTHTRFELDFNIAGSQWEGAFDRLEVFRSRSTQYGPYEALHGNNWAPAALPKGFTGAASGTGPSVSISGLGLELLVNEETTVNITFTGGNPRTFAQAATQIQAGSLGLLLAYASGNTLVIKTVGVGEAVTLRVVGGDAAPLLGLATTEPDSLSFGHDARIVLTHGQEAYGFVDAEGSATYWYKTRFYNSVNQLTSDYSLPFQGPQAPGLPPSSLVRCYVDLVDLKGNPYAAQEVLVFNQFNGTQVGGRTVAGGSAGLLTDVSGHAELMLPRGLVVTVSIPGTSLARDFTVPTDPTVQSISMLDPTVSSDDVFTVQDPHIPYAVKRTL